MQRDSPDSHNFKLRNFALKQFKKKERKLNYIFFKQAPKYFCLEIKAQRIEGGGRILLCDNAGGEAVMARPISFRCFGVRTSSGLPCVSLTVSILNSDLHKIRLTSQLPERTRCLRRSVPELKLARRC